jgi:hypothetical protein
MKCRKKFSGAIDIKYKKTADILPPPPTSKAVSCCLYQTIQHKLKQGWQPIHLASKTGGFAAPSLQYNNKQLDKPIKSIRGQFVEK